MGHVDQSRGRAPAVVDTKDDLGALVSGFGLIENAAIQFGYECRIGEPADDVCAGLRAISEDAQNPATIAQPKGLKSAKSGSLSSLCIIRVLAEFEKRSGSPGLG
jgi:hypothetical protein